MRLSRRVGGVIITGFGEKAKPLQALGVFPNQLCQEGESCFLSELIREEANSPFCEISELGEQPVGFEFSPDVELSEALGVGDAALKTSELRYGFQHVSWLGLVMIFDPLKLALVAEEHFLFGFYVIANVHVVGGLKIHTGYGVHVKDGDEGFMSSELGFVEWHGGSE